MKIAVLFDGGGLSRLGLEQAGHDCTGFEINPAKHYLSKMVGSGNSVLTDARAVDLSSFDAVWASPPCQERSDQKMLPTNPENASLLWWSLALPHEILWVENVFSKKEDNTWGTPYNAAQFLEVPVQRRRRLIGGRYKPPQVFRPYKWHYQKLFDVCPPAMTATEIYKGGYNRNINKERRSFSRWYKITHGRVPTIFDMAYHQGFEMPVGWLKAPDWWKSTQRNWLTQVAEALGNGVPVFMSKAFGEAYK